MRNTLRTQALATRKKQPLVSIGLILINLFIIIALSSCEQSKNISTENKLILPEIDFTVRPVTKQEAIKRAESILSEEAAYYYNEFTKSGINNIETFIKNNDYLYSIYKIIPPEIIADLRGNDSVLSINDLKNLELGEPLLSKSILSPLSLSDFEPLNDFYIAKAKSEINEIITSMDSAKSKDESSKSYQDYLSFIRSDKYLHQEVKSMMVNDLINLSGEYLIPIKTVNGHTLLIFYTDATTSEGAGQSSGISIPQSEHWWVSEELAMSLLNKQSVKLIKIPAYGNLWISDDGQAINPITGEFIKLQTETNKQGTTVNASFINKNHEEIISNLIKHNSFSPITIKVVDND